MCVCSYSETSGNSQLKIQYKKNLQSCIIVPGIVQCNTSKITERAVQHTVEYM